VQKAIAVSGGVNEVANIIEQAIATGKPVVSNKN